MIPAGALLLLALQAVPAPAPSPTATPAAPEALPPSRVAAIDTLVTAFMARHGVPGLSAAVALGPERVWARGYGLADVENNVAASERTMFRLASISKVVTATAVLQLVEREKLDLNAPIQRYVPAFPEKPWPVTPRQLLAHQSGLRHWREDEWRLTRRFASVAEGLQVFQDEPLLFEPGTRALYSSPGYNLLGAAVEGASGEPFVEYLRENVFAPAGLASAREDDVLGIIPNRAQGYAKGPDGELRNSVPSDTSSKVPGGGLTATAPDVARFGAALMAGQLVSALHADAHVHGPAHARGQAHRVRPRPARHRAQPPARVLAPGRPAAGQHHALPAPGPQRQRGPALQPRGRVDAAARPGP